MSVTGVDIPISPSAPTPERPDPQHYHAVDPDKVTDLALIHGRTYEVAVGRTQSVSARPTVGPVAFALDEDGRHIAADLLGAAYGVGATPEEALHDFYRALDDRLSFLREQEAALDKRLLRQLGLLQQIFPGR